MAGRLSQVAGFCSCRDECFGDDGVCSFYDTCQVLTEIFKCHPHELRYRPMNTLLQNVEKELREMGVKK